LKKFAKICKNLRELAYYFTVAANYVASDDVTHVKANVISICPAHFYHATLR